MENEALILLLRSEIYSHAHYKIEFITGSGAVSIRFRKLYLCRYFTMFCNI